MPQNKNDARELLNKSMLMNLLLAIVVIVLALILYEGSMHQTVTNQITTTTTLATTTTAIINQSNSTLAGIDQPFNATQMNVINNAPLSYYEIAGLKFLNGT